jgi:peptide alpha-N-acetyltransferase
MTWAPACACARAGAALAALGRCLEVAPTLPELYSVQARVLKHAGDPQGAAAAAVKAQSLDLADR